MSTIHPIVEQVTRRIRERSAQSRAAYLEQVDAMAARPPGAQSMGCANVAHAFAALPGTDKIRIVEEKGPNVGIVTAYNDVLSAHAPFAHYPDILKDEARRNGATALDTANAYSWTILGENRRKIVWPRTWPPRQVFVDDHYPHASGRQSPCRGDSEGLDLDTRHGASLRKGGIDLRPELLTAPQHYQWQASELDGCDFGFVRQGMT